MNYKTMYLAVTSLALQAVVLSPIQADILSDITDCNNKLRSAQTCIKSACKLNTSIQALEEKTTGKNLRSVIENVKSVNAKLQQCETEFKAIVTCGKKVKQEMDDAKRKAEKAVADAKEKAAALKKQAADAAKKEKAKFKSIFNIAKRLNSLKNAPANLANKVKSATTGAWKSATTDAWKSATGWL